MKLSETASWNCDLIHTFAYFTGFLFALLDETRRDDDGN